MSRYFSIILFLILTFTPLMAQKVTMSLWNVSLDEALRRIDHAQEERQIVFVANEIEKYRVTRHLFRKSALEAVYEVCGIYPIRITERGKVIFVEHIPQEKTQFIGLQPDTVALAPMVRYLDDVVVTCRKLSYQAFGYTIAISADGMQAIEALSFLPFVTRDGDKLKVNGQEVEQVFLDGMPLTSINELERLGSDLIGEVRVVYHPCQLYIRLRQPQHGGYYGSLDAGTTYKKSSGWAEQQVGGVLYARIKGLSLYDKFNIKNSRTANDIVHHSTDGETDRNIEDTQHLHTLAASNRMSAIYDFSDQQNLGLSYFLAGHRGAASSVMNQPGLRTYYFDGSNKHIDQELTLKYDLKWDEGSDAGKSGILDVLFDIYDRWTKSENVSLYGAGVGTEQGESPSITMYRLKADAQQTYGHYTFHLAGDLRWLGSVYDPDRYVSNFLGSPTNPYLLNKAGEIVWLKSPIRNKGMMLNLGMDAEAVWSKLRASAGVALRGNQQSYCFERGMGPVGNAVSRHDDQICSHLRLEIPLGHSSFFDANPSLLSVFYERRLEEIPYAAQSPAMRWNDAFNFSIGNIDLIAPTLTTFAASASLWYGRLNLMAAHRTIDNEIYWQTNVAHGQTDVFFTRPVNLRQVRYLSLQGELNLHSSARCRTKFGVQIDSRTDDETLNELHYSYDNHLNSLQVLTRSVESRHLHQRYTLDHNWRFSSCWNLLIHAQYEPTYRMLDRIYHTTWLLNGELQHSFLHNRLLSAITFNAAGRNRYLERRLMEIQIIDRWRTPLQSVGLRVSWNFSGGRKVNVGAVEGGQRYEELQEP